MTEKVKEKFLEFEKLVREIEDRKQALQEKRKTLIGLLSPKQQEYGSMIVAGENVSTIEAEIQKLESDIANVSRSLKAFESPKHKRTDKIVKIAKEIIKNNDNEKQKLQSEYEGHADELLKIKSEFLLIVSEMGELQKSSKALAREQNIVKKYIPGQEKLFHDGIIESLNFLRAEGAIFINARESVRAYEGVKQ